MPEAEHPAGGESADERRPREHVGPGGDPVSYTGEFPVVSLPAGDENVVLDCGWGRLRTQEDCSFAPNLPRRMHDKRRHSRAAVLDRITAPLNHPPLPRRRRQQRLGERG